MRVRDFVERGRSARWQAEVANDGKGTGSEAAVRVRVTVGEGYARPQAEAAGDG